MPNKHMQPLLDMGADELQAQVAALREELFSLKFRNRMRHLDNPLKIRAVRRQIARGEMLLARHEADSAAAPAKAAGAKTASAKAAPAKAAPAKAAPAKKASEKPRSGKEKAR